MKLEILGCCGSIGGPDMRTTSLLLDRDILVDAGTGLGELSIEALAEIDHVFLTHAHLDHIACLPLLIDSVAERRQHPITIYAIPEVVATLRAHIFNWSVWPDFAEVPTADQPFLRYREVQLFETVELAGRRITPLPVDHTVPAVGYRLDSGLGSLVFSGDTGPCPALWEAVNAVENLRYLIIECAFPDGEERLALLSKHLCPSLLVKELSQLKRMCDIHITHLKPGKMEVTMAEIDRVLGQFKPTMLSDGQIFEF